MNKVTIELRSAKKRYYYSSKITDQNWQKRNPKQVLKTINNLLGSQSKQTTVNELDIEEILTNPVILKILQKSSMIIFQIKHWSKIGY